MSNPVDALVQFIQDIGTNEVILFPGTFYPWHEGHSACLELAPKSTPLIVIPDRNPEKAPISNDLKELKEITDRNSKHYLFTHFLETDQSNPTYFWYHHLKKELPNIKIKLLMGFDAFNCLDEWIEGEKLLEELDCVLVVARLNQQTDFDQRLNDYQKMSAHFKAEFLGHHAFEKLASSKIKKGPKTL